MKFYLFAPLVLVVAGCGDPMRDMARLSDQEVAESAPTRGAVPAVEAAGNDRVGLFARLLGDAGDKETAPTAPETNVGAAAISTDGPSVRADVEPQQRRGLFAMLRGDADVAQKAEGLPASQPEGEAATPQVAEEPGAATAAQQAEPTKRKGLFARLFTGGGETDESSGATKAVSEVAYGTTLPYGVVKRICGLRRAQMGKIVARYPERRSIYKVYDSDPGTTGPHTFYVAGFDDGCARQFTASLAMFGSVEMHESLRYGLPAKVQPYSATDDAYEEVKARVCRVPRKKPCGSRVGRLADDTVFLSIYERFGGNSQWKNLLLHDGEMVAMDKKGV